MPLTRAGMSCSATDMFAFDESLGTPQSEGDSATAKLWDGESLSQRVSAIKSWFTAEQASAARLKNRPAVLPPESLVLGFSLGGGGGAAATDAAAAVHLAAVDGGAAVDAAGVVSGSGDGVHVNGGKDSHDEGDGGFVVAGQAVSNRSKECLQTSETDRLVSERPDMATLLSEGSLAKNFRLAEMRQTLLDHAEDLDQASDNQAGLGFQLTSPSISLTASTDAKSLHLHKLQDKELTSLQHGHRSALNFSGNYDTKAQHTAHNEASFSTWQLQDATTSTSHAATAGLVASASSSSLSFTDFPGHLISSTRPSMPASVADTLLNGNSPATKTCSRHNHKAAFLPRIRSARCRRASATPRHMAHCPDIAVGGGCACVHLKPLLHPVHMLGLFWTEGVGAEVQHSPLCGDSLVAVWQWLCSSGRGLTELGRKLRKKLLTALGLGEEEAQRLLAQQQAEEAEALSVRSYNPLQPVNRPEGHPRLQRWRM